MPQNDDEKAASSGTTRQDMLTALEFGIPVYILYGVATIIFT